MNVNRDSMVEHFQKIIRKGNRNLIGILAKFYYFFHAWVKWTHLH